MMGEGLFRSGRRVAVNGLFLLFAVFSFFGVSAQDTDMVQEPAVARDSIASPSLPGVFSFSGYVAIQLGQVERARYIKILGDIDHNWIGSGFFNFALKSRINKYLSVLGSLEAEYGYNTSPLGLVYDPTQGPPTRNLYFDIPNAKGIFSLGNEGGVSLTVDVGRFEYKYDPDARNLGEYLFRTGTFPAYIQTTFDLPLARINGIGASLKLFDIVKEDLLVTTLTDLHPFTDITITSITDVSIGRWLSLGAGIQLANLISPMPEQSALQDYKTNGYLNAPGDTAYYTYRGTKLMGRIMFDCKQLFSAPIFGPEDGKLYAEAALLGLESYPASDKFDKSNTPNVFGYDSIFQKIPVMMGFNIPTCKVLDVLSLEAEWYGCRYPDGYDNVVRYGLSVPDQPSNSPGYSRGYYVSDDWKWSVFASKTFFNKFSLIFQTARDHLRLRTQIQRDQDYQESLVFPRHWYWMFKAKFYF
jgi:hypothetical protein